MDDYKGEKLVSSKSTAKHKIYNFIDPENKIDQLSSEVFPEEKKIVHYPRGYDGKQKYKNITKIIFNGYNSNRNIPVGFIKSEFYGWGFGREMKSLANYLDSILKIKQINIYKDCEIVFDQKNKIISLSELFIRDFFDMFSKTFKKNKEDLDILLKSKIHDYLPDVQDKPETKYSPNLLANSIQLWGNDIDEFSDEDKKAINNLFDKLSLDTDFLSSDNLSKTKEIVDSKIFRKTITKFEELLNLKTDGDNLEKNWQKFLNKNNWVLTTMFAQPVVLFKREAYVGGKTIDNKDGKFNDFLLKNGLSENVTFLEIKTHLTKLVENTAYRGSDVFSVTKDITGSINQVLNQRDNFQKEYYTLKGKSEDYKFTSYNSQCIVLVGSIKSLTKKKLASFELFRRNSRDVEIITFDELLDKIKLIKGEIVM